jgi:formiminoglutamase
MTQPYGAQDCVMIGVPEDRGVAINRGRPGAAEGPAAFRAAFHRLARSTSPHLHDHGDVPCGAHHGDTHTALTASVQKVRTANAVPLVIGGGHDNSYGGIAGLVGQGRLGIINIDAHLDLRALEPDGSIGSGTPFRRLIDDGIAEGADLVEFGYHDHCTPPDLLAYARAHDVRLWRWDDVRDDPVSRFGALLGDLAASCDHVAISLDLDAIVASAAPGVSAPAVHGFSPMDVRGMLILAGRCPQVAYLDVMELNPRVDLQGVTARLAAVLAWHYLIAKGVCT